MKWILFFFIYIIVQFDSKGQIFFSDNIDLVGYSDAAWQISAKGGNYYVVTTSYCDLSPYQCAGLIKLNSDLTVAWKQTIEKVRIDQFTSIAVTDSSIFLAGRLLQPKDSLEITVIKFDFGGNPIAQWYYGNDLSNTCYGIAPSYDRGFVFLFNEHNQPPPRHTYLFRCDASGNVLWKKSIEVDYPAKRVYSIHATPDSAYVFGMYGCLDANCNNREGFVLKVNDYGDTIFKVRRDTTSNFGRENTYATFTKDGGAVFSRLEEGPIGVWDRQVLYKVDHSGNQLWEYHYDAGDYHRLWSIKEMQNSDIIAVGFNEDHPFIDTTGEYLRYFGGWIIRLSSTGEKKWERIIGDLRYPGDSFGEILDIVEAENGDLVAVGTIVDTFPNGIPVFYNRDVWLLHLDSMGCILPGCNGVFQGITPTSKTTDLLSLEMNFSLFPNPAKDWLSVSILNGSNYDDLTLTITDITGRIMYKKESNSEESQYIINTPLWPSGVYIVTLKNQRALIAKKIYIQ